MKNPYIAKLNNLNLTTRNFYILADFDNTITAKECLSNMGFIAKSNMFGNEFLKEIDKIFYTYKEKAINSNDFYIKNDMWNKTLKSTFELYKTYNLTKELLENIIQTSNIKFRDGFKEFWEFSFKENIPVIIISAGLKNCIEIFLKNNDAYFNNITILSNFIEFNNDGTIKTLPTNIINPVNKNNVCIPDSLHESLKNRENILVFGDVPGDIKMIDNKDKRKTFSVAFDNNIGYTKELIELFDFVDSDNTIFNILKKFIKE